jgi:hypothetical protein
MINRSFEISFSDLTSEFQDEMIESCVASLLEEVQLEGEALFKNEWHNPQPITWQEAWVRYNAVNYIMWNDYEKREPDAEVPKAEDWVYWLEEHLREIAEKACYAGVHNMEIEVEL